MSDKSKVLIVDDERRGRLSLEGVLLPEGYDLLFAGSGEEALEKTARFLPDLILLDVMMPGMNGYDVCRKIRDDPQTADIPVLFLTALNDRESRLQGIEAGADDFLSKPFDRVELRARVRTITRLNRHRTLLAERAKFERAVECAEDGYLLVDDHETILFANPKARLYLGLREDGSKRITAPFSALARQRYRCEPESGWQDWSEQPPEGAARYLVRPESPTAPAFWLRLKVLDRLPQGNNTILIVNLREVTADISSQSDMRKFQTVLSHKLRTPLNGLVGPLETMAMCASELSRPEIASLSSMALESAERICSALEDVMQYVDAPNLAQAGAGFRLDGLQAALNQICAALEIGPVAVSCPPELRGTQLSISPQAVEAVLWELLENAKKFHPHQSPVVEVSASRTSAETIRLQVSDDGICLSPEQLAQAWTPYYQGEKYATGEVPGMGLGLPLVAYLVWSVGGHCRIHNRSEAPGVTVELLLEEQEGGKSSDVVARESVEAAPRH